MTTAKFLTGSAILLAVAALSLSASVPVTAQESSEDDGPGSGVLMLTAKGVEQATPAIQLGTDMDVTVSGTVARVRVTQAFRNTSDKWVEARYVYPLPQDGAVDSLKMVVGQRVIVGRVKPREVAEKIYEKARDKGQRAGLVEEQRPNMFVNRVANIGPGETVLIAIEYQAPVRQVAGQFSLRLPLVVGPRYTPPHTLKSARARAAAAVVTCCPIAL
jgi:Ca-activated chloride channel family protein